MSTTTGTVTNSHAVDNFMDANLVSTWTVEGGYTEISAASLDYLSAGTTLARVAYKTATYGSADVQVSSKFTVLTDPGTNTAVLITSRGSSSAPWSGANAYYISTNLGSGVTEGIAIGKQLAGSSTSQTQVNGTFTNGAQYLLVLITKTNGSDVDVTGKIQRVSDSYWLNSSGTWAVTDVAFDTWTDTSSPFMSAGKSGVLIYAAASAQGVEIREFTEAAAP
jgi:hypothetical protein